MFEALGVITATTDAKNQSNTAVPFTIPAGERILVQPDVACWVKVGASGVAATTSATGSSLQLDAAEKFEFTAGTRLNLLSAIVGTGTVNLRVFRVY